MEITFRPVGYIENGYEDKFGIPRQSGLVSSVPARIILNEEYRVPEVYRGLDQFSHVWLLWVFSENRETRWSPTVRPPRLGGNIRMGVFATRSPNRPNPIGLSAVRIERLETDDRLGPVLWVSGADLMNGTPILDIKPYLPYSDSVSGAKDGFGLGPGLGTLPVEMEPEALGKLTENEAEMLSDILGQDPRPGYQKEDGREYGMLFAGRNIRFTVLDGTIRVLSAEIQHADENGMCE